MDRLISSDAVEQWMSHLRRQRQRANEMIWRIEQGLTIHEGLNGKPPVDATERWLKEQRAVVEEVTILTQIYQDENS